MTLPIERSWAIRNTRHFLYELMDYDQWPKLPIELRKRARSLLKHFPTDLDIIQVAEDSEEVFGDLDREKWHF
jgi:hypothetical protein